MKTLMVLGAVTATLGLGTTLATEYRPGRTIGIEVTTMLEIETTDFRFERDGVEEEPRFGGGGGGSRMERTIRYRDEVLAAEDGRPRTVRRAFEDVVRETAFGVGEESFGGETESSLAGVTLELALEHGELAARVVDGPELDAEQLEGHFLDLMLDALLPLGDVELGDSWELDDLTIRQALAFELDRALFPREGRGEWGRDGGGRRRGRGRLGGGRDLRLFRDGEWEGDAELVALDLEHGGRTVARIGLEMEASGEVEDAGLGRRRRRFVAGSATNRLGTELDIELEGHLLFDVESRLPVELVLEGTLTVDSVRAMDRRGSSIVIESTREGTFHHHVQVTTTEEDE